MYSLSRISFASRRRWLLTLACSLLLTTGASAAEAVKLGPFVPFPGTFEGSLVSVEDANRVHLMVEIWGAKRNLLITLPDIVVPLDRPGVPQCQREMAAAAKTLAESFLRSAEKIELSEIMMMDSNDLAGSCPIETNHGSLSSALLEAKLAQPKGSNVSEPWCTDPR